MKCHDCSQPTEDEYLVDGIPRTLCSKCVVRYHAIKISIRKIKVPNRFKARW